MLLNRRWGLLALVLPVVCGCQQRFSLKPGVHVGTTKAPVIGYVFVPAEYLALHSRLEDLLDAPVLFDPGLSQAAIRSHLLAGRLQFAILSAGEYAAMEDAPGIEPLASAVNEAGTTTSRGLIITRKDSPVQTVADCKGKRFAFGPSGDMLYDYAARAALRTAGAEPATELPPVSVTGRLHLLTPADVVRAVAFDLTITAGVVEESHFRGLAASGGSFITGASQDMFRIIGTTDSVPGLVVLAGPKADPVAMEKVRAFLIGRVKNEPEICGQMKIKGFTDMDANAHAAARLLMPK